MIGKAAFVGAMLAGLVAAASVAVAPAHALESDAVRSSRVTATLITDTDAVRAGLPLHVALRLRMAPGWHTYWSNPGDAGAPPEVTLALPAGAVAGAIAWPTPLRMPEGPVMAYGYTGEVVLPMSVTPGAGPLEIKAEATWLVCEKICVPEQGSFVVSLPAGTAGASAQTPLFAAAAAATPRPSPFEATVAPDGTLAIRGAGLSAATVQDAWFFPDALDVIDAVAPQPVRTGDGVVRIGLKPARGTASAWGTATAQPLSGVAVLVDRSGQQTSLQISARLVAGAAQESAAQESTGAVVAAPVWESMALALLGGLLLNLMPCVFPVLAMKAMALARMSGQSRSGVRAEAAAYTAGVLVAFAGLAGVLLAARGAGASAGWGFQFQSPVFVAAMAWVLFAVGLNLSGVFAVGGRMAGAGQGLASRPGHAGSFFTGLLAVLVATPCTAPFMGAAIAAALAAPAGVTMAIFLSMGLGLALPYLALSLVPGLHRALPRPGPWMDVLRGALAFPMYGAAAWLLWVITLQAGAPGVLVVGAGAVLIGLAAWAGGLAQRGSRRARIGGGTVAAVAVCAALALLPGVAVEPAPPTAATADAEAFSPARLAALQAAGRPVFVNMTAAWCVTCLVNERATLSSSAVQQAFRAQGVAYLKGDWTRSDPAITAYLQGFGRDGVPLYVFYPAGGGAPAVLPQILTQTEVLARLDGSRS